MNSPRYHANSAKKASSVIRRTVIKAQSRFKPEQTNNEFVKGLVDQELITDEQAKKILQVNSMEDFKEYCLEGKINGFGLLR